jgi:hypothetical protein
VAKKINVEDDGDDIDIDGEDDYEDIDSVDSVIEAFDARRRLENVLEDKALERLLSGDYDY